MCVCCGRKEDGGSLRYQTQASFKMLMVFNDSSHAGASPFAKQGEKGLSLLGWTSTHFRAHLCAFSKQGPLSKVIVDLILAPLGCIFLVAGSRDGVILIINYMLYFQLFQMIYRMTLTAQGFFLFLIVSLFLVSPHLARALTIFLFYLFSCYCCFVFLT